MSAVPRPGSAPLLDRVSALGVPLPRSPSPFRQRDAEAPALFERLGRAGVSTCRPESLSYAAPTVHRPTPVRARSAAPATPAAAPRGGSHSPAPGTWSPSSQRTLLTRLARLGVSPAPVPEDSPQRRASVITRQYNEAHLSVPLAASSHSHPATPERMVHSEPIASSNGREFSAGGPVRGRHNLVAPAPAAAKTAASDLPKKARRRRSRSRRTSGSSKKTDSPAAAAPAPVHKPAPDPVPEPEPEPVPEPLASVVVPSVGKTGAAWLEGCVEGGKVVSGGTGAEGNGPHQNSTDPWTVTPDDISPPMLKDGDYIDSLTFIAVTPDACVLLTQLLVSNLGMSARVGVQVKLTNMEGVVKFVKDEMPVKALEIENGGLRLKMTDRNTFTWDPATQTGHVTIDNPSQGISIDLEYRADGGGYKIGDGLCSFGPRRFQFLAYPAPRAIVTGRATVGGNPVAMQRALGFVSHAYQNMRAHHIACRWHMVKFHSHDAGVSVNVNVGVAPKSHGHVPMGNAVLCRNGIVEVCGTGGSVRFPTAHTDKRTGYQVPDSAVYSLRGTDSLGRRVEVDLPVPSVNVVERLDVLAELPWVLRQIIKAFIAKPYFYVFLNRIEAVIRVEGLPEVRCKGVIVHEILALNAGPDAPM